jgi:hypothetical protein
MNASVHESKAIITPSITARAPSLTLWMSLEEEFFHLHLTSRAGPENLQNTSESLTALHRISLIN